MQNDVELSEVSCKDRGSHTLSITNAAGKGASKDDALFDLMQRIIDDAARKNKHSCSSDCGTGILFCFTTVDFENEKNIKYAPLPPEQGTDEKTGKKIMVKMIAAQYSGNVTLTCNCFGIIHWTDELLISSRVTSKTATKVMG